MTSAPASAGAFSWPRAASDQARQGLHWPPATQSPLMDSCVDGSVKPQLVPALILHSSPISFRLSCRSPRKLFYGWCMTQRLRRPYEVSSMKIGKPWRASFNSAEHPEGKPWLKTLSATRLHDSASACVRGFNRGLGSGGVVHRALPMEVVGHRNPHTTTACDLCALGNTAAGVPHRSSSVPN